MTTPRYCGSCVYHDAQRQVCAINMAYQAWVYTDTPAHDCPSWGEKKAPTVAQQSQCRPGPYCVMGVKIDRP